LVAPMRPTAIVPALITFVALLLAGPASADTVPDLAVSQSASSTLVKKGETVTITVTVQNLSAVPRSPGVGVQMAGLGGGDLVTSNPYLSASPSQGSCSVEGEGAELFCRLGEVTAGATVQITAAVKMEETMNHVVGFAIEDESGRPANAEYSDGHPGNDFSSLKITASPPPVSTGSPKIRLPGLPQGCVSSDFPLTVVAPSDAKKVKASLFLGFDEDGAGHQWQRVAGGPRLATTVPISQLREYRHPYLATEYKLKIKARLAGGARLTRTIEFQLCAVAAQASRAPAPPTLYEVKQAQLKVDESGSYSGGAVSWSGKGDRQEKYVPDPELPSLPAPLPSSGGGVAVLTQLVSKGEETEIDEEGKKDPCSGSWTEEESGGFTVLVKPLPQGKLETIWEIPHGIATNRCGFGYDLLPGGTVREKSIVKGHIGAGRLVLTVKDKEGKSRARGGGRDDQELEWDGEVVLERVTKK
jgi:hypothetical protein